MRIKGSNTTQRTIGTAYSGAQIYHNKTKLYVHFGDTLYWLSILGLSPI